MGDEVKPGVVLAGIETDKATVDFEMQEEGYIAAILYPEGAKDIVLGTPIAILVEEKEDIAAFANYKGDDSSAAATPAPATPAPKQASSSKPAASYPDHVKLEMPNLSPTMEKVSSFIVSITHKGKHQKVEPEDR